MYSDIKKIAERIKALREIFGCDIQTMAKITEVSVEDYTLAEMGKWDFNFSFLQKIAKHFNVDIISLISGNSPNLDDYEITAKGEGVPLERHKGFKYLHLAPHIKDKVAQPFMVTAKFSEEEQYKEIPTSTHNDEEFDYVLKGKLKFRVGNTYKMLSEGDSAYYDATIPHGMIATDGQDCEFLSVVIKKPVKEKQEVPYEEVKPQADENKIYNRYVTTLEDANGHLLDISFNPPQNFNFAYDVVDAVALKAPNKRAMLWLSHDKKERLFTFNDMKVLSDKCANMFVKSGIKRGDRVMLVLKRHYQFWIAILALHKIGAVAIPATNQLVQKDFEYRFEAAGVSAIVCTSDGDTAKECEEAFKSCPFVTTRFIVGKDREGWINFDKYLEECSDKFERKVTDKDDLMLMYFTSGTTGYPKIASHSYTYALGHLVTAKYWQNVEPDGLHFTISDTGWGKAVWGKLYGQWLCEAGVFTYDFDKFDADDILPLFAKYNITTFCAPPTMYRFFIKSDLKKYNLSSLKYACVAGEALNPEVYDKFYEATGISLMEGFGQTETTLTVANLIGTKPKPGSMGKPNPQYKIDILNSDGTSCKVGEQGEIVIATENGAPYGMFKEYYRHPELTQAAWHNGYYHTGDMAWKDEDGYFWYVGRIDDLIKSSGYRIGPFEIESVIMELPYVLECAITGVPDETRGQIVKATIVLTKGTKKSDELKTEIQNYVKHHTAPYKYPRVVEFVDSLPKTISGKIRRTQLREG